MFLHKFTTHTHPTATPADGRRVRSNFLDDDFAFSKRFFWLRDHCLYDLYRTPLDQAILCKSIEKVCTIHLKTRSQIFTLSNDKIAHKHAILIASYSWSWLINRVYHLSSVMEIKWSQNKCPSQCSTQSSGAAFYHESNTGEPPEQQVMWFTSQTIPMAWSCVITANSFSIFSSLSMIRTSLLKWGRIMERVRRTGRILCREYNFDFSCFKKPQLAW